MPITPFRSMDFDDKDVITQDKMDQLQANYQWIIENTPRGGFYLDERGNRQDTGLVIVAGRTKIKKNRKSDDGSANVKFPAGTFDPKCRPSVVTGIVCDFQTKVFCVVNGPGGAKAPQPEGFTIRINIDAGAAKNDIIERALWVSWVAMGYGVGAR